MTNNTTNPLTILLLGSGGREHALAWKLVQSPRVGRLVCAPGNPGMAGLAELASADIESGAAVVALARETGADLVVVGPEAPLAAGVSDALSNAGIHVFGPSKAAARLEWDKAYAKEFMQRHGIPTAASRTFTAGEIEPARDYVRGHAMPVVIKASGLAAGKGVVIATTPDEAVHTVDDMLSGAAFGDAGSLVVVEEFMEGEEASIFAIADGEHYVLLAPSQDHKRVGDGDTGPNTGGMGAYAPAPVVNEVVLERVVREIIEPTLRGMREDGNPYAGCLFVGLMINNDEPRVVEFNSRFGDPETQVILPLYDGDLAELLLASATGTLGESVTEPGASGTAVCVVMASEGYPGSYRKGSAITGINEAEQAGGLVFHAGTKRDGEQLVTSGGRVLGVTAISREGGLPETIARAYEAIRNIHFDGGFFRSDIGAKAGEVKNQTSKGKNEGIAG